MNEMTEKEMQTVKMSTLYQLRLIISTGDKTEYTRDEILELLDKIATAKRTKLKKALLNKISKATNKKNERYLPPLNTNYRISQG